MDYSHKGRLVSYRRALGQGVKALALGVALATLPVAVSAQEAPAPITAPSGTYNLDKAHASLIWRIKHLGLSWYTARLTDFDATITYDAANPTRSTVVATIDPKSVRTDFPFPEKENFDKVIAEKFLLAGEHPRISFQSTSLVATGPGTGRMTGNLTMAGVTRPVTLDVTMNGAINSPYTKEPVVGFSAKGSFNRSDFGLKDMIGVLSDEIQIAIEAEFQKK